MDAVARALMAEPTAPTPTLATYLAMLAEDPELPYKVHPRHLVAWLDEAVEALEASLGTANDLRALLANVLPEG